MSRNQVILPWAIVEIGDVGDIPNEGYTPEISMPLDQVAKNMARRKTWRVYGSLSWDVFTWTFDDTIPTNVTVEDDLIPALDPLTGATTLGAYGTVGSISLDEDTTALPTNSLEISLQVGFFFSALPVLVIGNSEYYPPLTISAETSDGARYVFANSEAPGAEPSNVTCTWAGIDIPMLFDDANHTDFDSGDITIEAPDTEGYHEFRDADGLNPVFDIDTGVRLIDPIPTS